MPFEILRHEGNAYSPHLRAQPEIYLLVYLRNTSGAVGGSNILVDRSAISFERHALYKKQGFRLCENPASLS